MAKIDDRFNALQNGFQNPQVTTGNTWITDEQMPQLQLRRKQAGQSHHKVWYLSIGESGQQMTTFWGHDLTDALVKAEKWRGTYVRSSKGPRKQAAEE